MIKYVFILFFCIYDIITQNLNIRCQRPKINDAQYFGFRITLGNNQQDAAVFSYNTHIKQVF